MKLFRSFCSLMAFGTIALAGAVGPDSTICIVNDINASEWISVSQPDSLYSLLQRQVVAQSDGDGDADAEYRNTAVATRAGYRIQVFDDNNPRTAHSQAREWQQRVQQAFPQWRAYVNFNSPYWQVKVGDFRRRGEAEAALADIRNEFPSISAFARIVPEKINITE